MATFLDVASPPGSRIAILVSFDEVSPGRRAPGVEEALVWLNLSEEGALRLFADGDPFDYPFEMHVASGRWQFVSKVGGTGVPRWRLPSEALLGDPMPRIVVTSAGIGAGGWVGPLLEQVPFDGVVLEAYGAGDVPPDVADQIAACLSQGGHVVVTSLARPGLVEPTYPGIPGTSHGLLSAGCHGGGLLTARQARVRLAVALASGVEDALRHAFATFDA